MAENQPGPQPLRVKLNVQMDCFSRLCERLTGLGSLKDP